MSLNTPPVEESEASDCKSAVAGSMDDESSINPRRIPTDSSDLASSTHDAAEESDGNQWKGLPTDSSDPNDSREADEVNRSMGLSAGSSDRYCVSGFEHDEHLRGAAFEMLAATDEDKARSERGRGRQRERGVSRSRSGAACEEGSDSDDSTKAVRSSGLQLQTLPQRARGGSERSHREHMSKVPSLLGVPVSIGRRK